MKKKLLALILATSVVFAAAGVGTMAWFTSQSTSSNNSFTAGTLVLGGDENVEEVFARVEFTDLQPGDSRTVTSNLRNLGSLPFYLYRMTASTLRDNTPNNEKDDAVLLNSILDVEIKINNEIVYEGKKLADLVASNGGFFDPIFNIPPDNTANIPLEVKVTMPTSANNDYQGLSMVCDFTVYASQNEQPLPGEGNSSGNKYYFGRTAGNGTNNNPYFSVEGYNTSTYANFDWDWEPNDTIYEKYLLEIKHEKGYNDDTVSAERETVFIWIIPIGNRIEVEVEGEGPLNKSHISVDWNQDIVKIKKAPLLAAGWDGFEVKFSGKRSENQAMETIYNNETGSGYHYWYITDRQ